MSPVSGTVPSCRDLLKTIVRIGARSKAQSFRIRTCIQPGTVAFLGLVLFKRFITWRPYLSSLESLGRVWAFIRTLRRDLNIYQSVSMEDVIRADLSWWR